MYDPIIWATHGSEGDDCALAEVLRLAGLSGGRVVAAHCDQRLNGRAMAWPVDPDEEDVRAKICGQVAALRDAGVDIELVIRKSHHGAADVVAEIARDAGAHVIVCGTRRRGAFSGALLGSFTTRLLHVTPCSVLAVPETALVQAAAEPDAAEVGA